MKLQKAIQSANLIAATTHARAKADAVEGRAEPTAIPPWPWVVHEERFVAAKDGSPVVNMCHPNKAIAKKIAPLLAAAPELLEALSGMLEWARRVKVANPGPEIAAALKAVAKAKGQL